MGGRAISREKGWFENQLRAKITRDKRWIIGGGRGKFKYVPFTAEGGRGEGGKFGWIEFDKRVDSLTQVPSGFGYGVAVLEIGLSRQRLGGGGRKFRRRCLRGLPCLRTIYCLPNPGVDYGDNLHGYTDTSSFVSIFFLIDT